MNEATAREMLEMLKRVRDTVPSLDWTGMGCCPFCEWVPMDQEAQPCQLLAVIAKAEAPRA
jgi:hypothetical protein